jgi:hypothetical protein
MKEYLINFYSNEIFSNSFLNIKENNIKNILLEKDFHINNNFLKFIEIDHDSCCFICLKKFNLLDKVKFSFDFKSVFHSSC